MLELALGLPYYSRMTKIKIILASIPILPLMHATFVWATAEDPPALSFSAVNAGYKDDLSSHNFDFIELRKTGDDLPLADYKITYYNSSDNPSGEISFGENAMLVADSLVLGFHNSPQFSELPEEYLYKFGSSGLASTGGRLQLL